MITVGFMTFIVGSMIGMLSEAYGMLIIARVLQAAGRQSFRPSPELSQYVISLRSIGEEHSAYRWLAARSAVRLDLLQRHCW